VPEVIDVLHRPAEACGVDGEGSPHLVDLTAHQAIALVHASCLIGGRQSATTRLWSRRSRVQVPSLTP
jgi:hypothetical protein